MSLNTSTTPDGRGVLLYNGEIILLYTKNVKMQFEHTSEAALKGSKDGALYLTSHRIIFVNNKQGQPFTSFALPFFALEEVKLEQPLFGSNYLKGRIQALPGGNFSGDVKWKLTFPKGGCIEFGQALLHATELASRQRPTNAPPEYFPTAPPASYYAAPATMYSAPPTVYYGVTIPTQAFPERPQSGNVYVYDQPPPYPGIAPLPTYDATNGGMYPAVPPSAPYAMGSNMPVPVPSSAPPPPYPEAGPLPQKN